MNASDAQVLAVLICGKLAGRLRQHCSGELDFEYSSDYVGPPLSLNMPVTNDVYGDKVVRPYLLGLLPDDRALRQRSGRELGVSGNNPFALLAKKGYDCPGAVQICPFNRIEEMQSREGVYRKVAPEEIGRRIKRMVSQPTMSWQTPNEHWSLGGQQSKIALACFDGQWYECEGSAATTHILKPGISGLPHQALNEHFCLRLAALCGLPAAYSTFQSFGEASAIVVERYDRKILAPQVVLRLHQEDFCQALGIVPDNKYASEGGPSASGIMNFLAEHQRAQNNKIEFAAQLFFNYLVGAPDAHGKNYSVLLDEKGVPYMAPLYDVASGFPYELAQGEWRAAMSIGGQNQFGRMRRSNIERFAEAASIDPKMAITLMANIADSILREMPKVIKETESYDGGDELASRMAPAIIGNCEKTISFLEAK